MDADARRSRAGRMRRLTVDLRPLRASRDFRLLWTGELVSQFGSMITTVALFVQVNDLTGSAAAVGLIGLVQLVPMVIVALGFSPQVDRRDRRRLIIGAQVGLTFASLLLFGGALVDRPPLALLYGAAALNAGFQSIAMPTRAAMTPNLVGPDLLASAGALNQMMWNAAGLIGPAVGGVLVGRLGLAWAYGLDVVTYLVALAFSSALHSQRPRPSERAHTDRGLTAVLAGLRYLRGKRVLQSTFTIDLVAMVFAMPRALFPILAAQQFHRGPEAVGWLFSAIAAGAVVAAVGSGWVGHIRRQGRAITIAVTVWGLGITAFGLAGDNLAVALVALAVAGGADMISAVFRNTVQQLVVPDDLRGRVSSINIFVVAGGPRLGDLRAGLVANATTPTVAVVSGGVLCLAGVAVIAAAVPRFETWRVGDPP